MLFTGYDDAEIMELFKEDGRREGKKLGLDAAMGLIKKLQELGRDAEIDKVVSDANYRDALLAEFGIQ